MDLGGREVDVDDMDRDTENVPPNSGKYYLINQFELSDLGRDLNLFNKSS
jgi:hypothetical protein